MRMHIITDTEWKRLSKLTAGDGPNMHWCKMYSWVDDEGEFRLGKDTHALRGYWASTDMYLACRTITPESPRMPSHGFRPTITGWPGYDAAWPVKDGDIVIVGTLYMDGVPVPVPRTPTETGDIADYIPGAKLELKPALPIPAFQVFGILDGDKVYCDRNLLKNISYEDIIQALA